MSDALLFGRIPCTFPAAFPAQEAATSGLRSSKAAEALGLWLEAAGSAGLCIESAGKLQETSSPRTASRTNQSKERLISRKSDAHPSAEGVQFRSFALMIGLERGQADVWFWAKARIVSKSIFRAWAAPLKTSRLGLVWRALIRPSLGSDPFIATGRWYHSSCLSTGRRGLS